MGAAAAAGAAVAAAAAAAAAAAGAGRIVQGHVGGGGYTVERIEREGGGRDGREEVGVCPCAGTTDYTVYCIVLLHRETTPSTFPLFSYTALTRPPPALF